MKSNPKCYRYRKIFLIIILTLKIFLTSTNVRAKDLRSPNAIRNIEIVLSEFSKIKNSLRLKCDIYSIKSRKISLEMKIECQFTVESGEKAP